MTAEIFGNQKEDKIRACINLKKNGANDWVRSWEAVWMPGFPGWLAVLVWTAKHTQKRIEEMWKEDYPNGFHLRALAKRSSRYCIVRCKMASGRVALFAPKAVPYGPKAAPAGFCKH